MESKTIALFDMDLIAYRSSAAVEKRSVKVIHKATGKEKIFKTRTEFKSYLAEKNISFDPDFYEISDVQEAEDESHAFHIVNNQVKKIVQDTWADEYEGFIGGKDNFRLNLDLPIEYKVNRKTMIRPILLKATKEYIIKKHKAKLIEGIEVDDEVIIRWHELKAQGHNPVVITLDKDTKGCVGVSFYNWTEDNPSIVEVPVLGEVSYDSVKKKVNGIGLKFYCYQLLKGDNSDDYSPSDIHNKRFGDVSAVNLIKDCTTVNECFEAVENQYKKWFPSPVTYSTFDSREVTKDYKEILEMYHQCVYMKRKRNDTTSFDDLKKELSEKAHEYI